MKVLTRIARFALLLTVSAAVAQDTPQIHSEPAMPVFALAQAFSESEPRIDPIFLLSDKRVIPFPDPLYANPQAQALLKKYVHPGARYTVVYGGGNMGSVELGPEGAVKLHSPVPINGLRALAVDPAFVVPSSSTRRKPTSNERARAALLAKSIFAARGVKASAFARMELGPIDVMPLDTESLQIIATVDIMQPGNIDAEYTATFIGRENSPAADVLWFQHPKQANEVEQLYLLDCIDTDGDGVKELVAMRIYYEATSYEIYKHYPAGWKKVFSTPIHREF